VTGVWIRTQANELVNLDSVEYIVVGRDEDNDEDSFELQAFTFGSMPADPGEEYYPLMSSEDVSRVEFALDRVARGLAAGEAIVDLRG
jgi:hypothetical protein